MARCASCRVWNADNEEDDDGKEKSGEVDLGNPFEANGDEE